MRPTYHITVCLRFVNLYEKPKGFSGEIHVIRPALLNSFGFYGYNRLVTLVHSHKLENMKHGHVPYVRQTMSLVRIVLPSKKAIQLHTHSM